MFLKSFHSDYKVIIFTETWLKPDVLDTEVFSDNYQVFRKDRTSKKGGGVLIAVHNTIPSEFVEVSVDQDIEFVSAKLTFLGNTIFLTCSYIPPNSGVEIYLNHANFIAKVSSLLNNNSSLICMGDFNLPGVAWIPGDNILDYVPSTYPIVFDAFWDKIFELCLYQVNDVLNVKEKLLDLVFSSTLNISIFRGSPYVIPEDIYHPTLTVNLELKNNSSNTTPAKTSIIRRNFAKTNIVQLRSSLFSTIWDLSGDIDSCVSRFYELLNTSLNNYVPTVNKLNDQSPPWFTPTLKRFRNIKSRLFKKFKNANTALNSENSRCYYQHLTQIRLNLLNNPKCFFKFVNSKRRAQQFPSCMKLGSKESSDNSEIANLFADFFQSSYTQNAYSGQYNFQIDKLNHFPRFCLTEDEVYSGLKALRSSFSPGPDGVPTYILKSCANELFLPLTKLFNYSSSYVIPLHKSGNRCFIDNYRCIAKLSAIPKLFELLVSRRISHFIKSIISPFQHGFMKGRSTTSNLLEFVCHVHNGFANKQQTDVIYTDFSKAFDTVVHKLLLHKLNVMGFPSILLSWISSYLEDRTQKVLFSDSFSKDIVVSSGVPQGSHLGPLLFVLYLNDLPNSILYSKILMYADDVKLFSHINTRNSVYLQYDLHSLFNWCSANGMSLNLKKCKKFSLFRSHPIQSDYFIGSYKLDNVDSFSDLGVILDPKLRFHLHIDSCVNKAKSLLGFIKRWSKEFDDPYVTKRLFVSIVRPVLEYGCILWSPFYKCHCDKIESVQVQFLIFALRGLNWNPSELLPPYKSRLLLINLPTLEKRRFMLRALFSYGRNNF